MIFFNSNWTIKVKVNYAPGVNHQFAINCYFKLWLIFLLSSGIALRVLWRWDTSPKEEHWWRIGRSVILLWILIILWTILKMKRFVNFYYILWMHLFCVEDRTSSLLCIITLDMTCYIICKKVSMLLIL